MYERNAWYDEFSLHMILWTSAIRLMNHEICSNILAPVAKKIHYPPGNTHIFLPFDTFESMIFLFARWDTVDGSEIPSNHLACRKPCK